MHALQTLFSILNVYFHMEKQQWLYTSKILYFCGMLTTEHSHYLIFDTTVSLLHEDMMTLINCIVIHTTEFLS